MNTILHIISCLKHLLTLLSVVLYVMFSWIAISAKMQVMFWLVTFHLPTSGFGVGSGVGLGVGLGVGTGVGLGVGAGVGLGVGAGVGAGVDGVVVGGDSVVGMVAVVFGLTVVGDKVVLGGSGCGGPDTGPLSAPVY
jgi:hypothetical protein